MTAHINRRTALAAVAAVPAAAALAAPALAEVGVDAELRPLWAKSAGRSSLFVIETGDGE
jgi:hypothetical protein